MTVGPMGLCDFRPYGACMDGDERTGKYEPTLALLRHETERQLADVAARHANMHTRATVAVAVAAVVGIGGGALDGDLVARGIAGVCAVAAAVFAVASLLLERSPAADMSALSEAERTLYFDSGAYATEYRIWIDEMQTLRNGHSDLVRKGQRLNVSFALVAVALVVAVAAMILPSLS